MKGLAYLGNNTVGLVEKPEPKLVYPTDAIIEVTTTCVCTTDVENVAHGRWKINRIFGHEAVGVVKEVGDMVRYVKPGDRVVCLEGVPILDHELGLAGIGNHCEGPDEFTSRTWGSDIYEGMLTTHILYPRADTGLAVIPDDVTDEQALMLTDMVPTAATGIKYLDIQLGETVAVLGIGPVGLMGVELAKMRGAGRIFGTGSRPVCKEAALELGATDILDYHDGPLSDQILAKNNGPVDKVLICGGTSDIIAESYRMCRPGGKIANVAGFSDVSPRNAEAVTMTWDREFNSLYYYADRLQVKRWLEMVRYGRLHPEKLITHVYHGIDSLEESFHKMAKKEKDLIKTIVKLK